MNAPFRIEPYPAHLHGVRPVRAKLTLDDFYKMDEMGLLARFGRTELIDGEIIALNALYLPHARLHKRIVNALDASVASSGLPLEVIGEVTAEVDQHNGTLPDIVIFEPAAVADNSRGVPASAIRLLVEVSASSAKRDLGRKRKLYARGGLAEYWVASIPAGKMIRFAEPVDGDYRQRDEFAFADGISSTTLLRVAVPAGVLAG